MATVSPREALGYALGREMILLYLVVGVGYLALLAGGWAGANWAVRGGGAGVLGRVVAVGLLLAGFVTVLGGVVGLVYKVVADATAAARRSA
ncbi:hypothetical protein [Halobellus rubicundus]|uniref:Uncharacterized protein n=1 Tax=Halobellus rubicundus TaxID=2996466 RepID=A0ABD5MCS6_9EURY